MVEIKRPGDFTPVKYEKTEKVQKAAIDQKPLFKM